MIQQAEVKCVVQQEKEEETADLGGSQGGLPGGVITE